MAPIDRIEYEFVQGGARIHKTVHYFLMEPIGGDLARHDHEFDEVRWIALADAPALLTFETERALVERAAGMVAAGRRVAAMTETAQPGRLRRARRRSCRATSRSARGSIDFGGWRMPVQYTGDPRGAPRRPRSAPGSSTCRTWASSSSRVPRRARRWPARSSTDPPSLAVGRAHYSMICAPDGGIIDDLIVYRLARGAVPGRRQRLQRAAVVATRSPSAWTGFDAVLDDRSLATALVAVQGPAALRHPRPARPTSTWPALRYYAIAEGSVAGIPALVARTGYTGEDGFEVFVDVAPRPRALGRPAARPAGRPGLVPVGLGARDTLRLEAGMPLYGNELDRATTPFEAGLGRVVKLDKAGRLRRPGGARAGRRDGPAPDARRPRRARARHRPPRLPGLRRRRGAPASSRAAPCRRRWACRSRWPTSPRPMPSPVRCSRSRSATARVAAEVVPLPFYTPGPMTRPGRRRGGEATPVRAAVTASARRFPADGPERSALHQGARMGPRRRATRRRSGITAVRGRPARRHRLRRAARARPRGWSSSRRSASSSR